MKGSVKGKQMGPFVWGDEQQEAFDKLKTAFTTALVLVHFNPKRPIQLETDASSFAISAIIS